jgi:hypothetical protein
LETLTLREYPLFVAIWKQVASVKADGPLQGGDSRPVITGARGFI